MLPDEPNEEEKLEELPEDNETPFRPVAPPRDPDTEADDDRQNEEKIDDTHPATDSNIEREEVYEGGLAVAADAQEPNAGNNVVAFNPPNPDDSGEPGTDKPTEKAA